MLQNADRRPRDGQLSGPGDLYDTYNYVRPAYVIRREPLVYGPTSSSRPNHARLPDLGSMAGMELAYREQPFTERDLGSAARMLVGGVFVVTLLVATMLVVTGRFLSTDDALWASGGLVLVHVAWMLYHRAFAVRRLLIAVVGWPALFLLAQAASFVLLNRVYGTLLCGTVTIVLFAMFGNRPFRFYHEWIYAHPRLRPATRRTCPPPGKPDLTLLAIILGVVLVVPAFSTGAALLTIIGLCMYKLVRLSLLDMSMASAADALTHWLTYGMNSSYAPGVWRPRLGAVSRVRTAIVLLVPFYLTLSVGLTTYFLDREFYTTDRLNRQTTTWAVASRSPVWWMEVAIYNIRQEQHRSHLWSFVFAIIIGTAIPPFVLAAVYAELWTVAARLRRNVEGRRTAFGTNGDGLDDDGRPEWQWYVDRMKDSSHVAIDPVGERVREAEHLFVGVEPHARFPVLLDEKLLSEHAYMVGDTGSGKTSLGMMPLLIQLIRGHRGVDGAQMPCPPVVVIDLKGDPALFHTVKAESEARGAEFRFFTPEKGRASHYFNPFDSMASENRTDIQLTNLILDALSLNHGEGYGRGFYSRQSRQLLFDALTGKEKPRSFKDLYTVVKKLRGESDAYKDTLELVSTIHALQSYPMLAVGRRLLKPEQAIHMPSVLERRQVVYFWLPAAVESISVREIAKLALYSLLTAAIDRHRTKPRADQRQAYVFIDEFQRVAGENFKVILEQARSFGLAAILANQSISDLHTADVDLRPTIRTNTRVKRYFSVTDPMDVKTLSDGSGEEIMFLRSWTQIAGRAPYTELIAQAYNMRSDTQSLKNRLTVNDILAVSDHPLDSILHVSRGSGYTQFAGLPIPVRCSWPIPLQVYQERQDAPWPAVERYDEGEVVVSDKSPVDIEYERDREKAEQIHQALSELWANNA